MKLCKKILVVVLYISTAADCVGFDLKTVQGKLAASKKNTLAVQRALRNQYPDPEADDARELYGFVHGVREPLLEKMGEFIKFSKNLWLVKESDAIFALCVKRYSEQTPISLPEMGSAQQNYTQMSKMFQAYGEELDARHPESCSVCPKSFWLRTPRCAELRKNYTLSLSILGLFKKAAQLEQCDPALLEKYAQLDPTMLGHRVAQETKDGN